MSLQDSRVSGLLDRNDRTSSRSATARPAGERVSTSSYLASAGEYSIESAAITIAGKVEKISHEL